jgi:hypothetical protein
LENKLQAIIDPLFHQCHHSLASPRGTVDFETGEAEAEKLLKQLTAQSFDMPSGVRPIGQRRAGIRFSLA